LNATGTCFHNQANSWGASNLRSNLRYTVCSNDFILGGHDILNGPTDYFFRDYSNLPPHSMIYYTMTAWAIDSWDLYVTGSNPPGDTFVMDFDGTQFPGPYMRASIFPAKSCGRLGNNDLGPIRIFGKLPHSLSTLTLRVRGAFDENTANEAFGFRNLILLFVTNPDVTALGSTTASLCGIAPITLPDKQCPCQEGQFQYSVAPFTCSPCHPNCASCFDGGPRSCYQCALGASFVNGQCVFCDASCKLCSGPSPTQCITCQPGLFLYQNRCIPECTYPSLNTTDGCINYCSAPCPPNQFLYWNGSCLSTCPSQLNEIIYLASFKKCEYPCGTGEYLYWDGSCKKECQFPLNIRIDTGAQYCDYPCANNEFLYINGSCEITCHAPFSQRFIMEKQFCEYPCAPGEFLHQDGSCLSFCNPPFIPNIYTTHKVCDSPCMFSDYLYWNSTCNSSCPPSLQKYSIGKIKYCTPKCSNNQFLFWNGSCISSCEFPLKAQNQLFGNVCLHPCPNPTDFYNEDTNTCSNACIYYSKIENGLYLKCPSSSAIEASGLLTNLLLSAPFGTTTFVTFAKLVRYMKYINIKFPPRLERLRISGARTVLNLKLEIGVPHNYNNSFTKQTIPKIFEKSRLHSSFLVNFWQELISLSVLLGLAMILIMLEVSSKSYNCPLVQKLCQNFRYIFKWNLILVLFAINIDEVILYSALEFKTFHDDSVQSIISFLLGLFMFLACLAFFPFSLILSSKASHFNNLNNLQEFLEKNEGFQVLFRGYKNNSFINRRFFSFYLLRFILPMLFASYCDTVPLLQSIIYFTIGAFTLLIIICNKPFENRINYVQSICIETLTLINNICLLILISFDTQGNTDHDSFILTGDLIILTNVTTNFLQIVFLVYKIIDAIKNSSKQSIRNLNQKSIFSTIAFIVIQQAGFGFEHAESIDSKNFCKSKDEKLCLSAQNTHKGSRSNYPKINLEQNIFSETKEEFSKQGISSTNIIEHTKRDGAKKRLISHNEKEHTNSDIIEYDNMNDELILFNGDDQKINGV